MIFYFTATGNGKFIAERISAATGERIIDIAACVRNGSYTFDLYDGETVGLVVPVYFRGIPIIAAEFLQKLNIAKKPSTYCYAVLNCGGTASAAEKTLLPAFHANAVFDVAFSSNYVPLFKVGGEESIKAQLDKAELEIDGIVKHIKDRDNGVFKKHAGRFPSLFSFFAYPLYKNGRKTNKFTVNDSCTGCGLCEQVCPRGAIKLENGKPVWIIPKCEICLGCLHRCPVAAINYGRKSAEHGRYVNPRVKF